jgi:hypothetical protein
VTPIGLPIWIAKGLKKKSPAARAFANLTLPPNESSLSQGPNFRGVWARRMDPSRDGADA